MGIEDMIRIWKGDEQVEQIPENPVGHELSDEDLMRILGGAKLVEGCSPKATCHGPTCQVSCRIDTCKDTKK